MKTIDVLSVRETFTKEQFNNIDDLAVIGTFTVKQCKERSFLQVQNTNTVDRNTRDDWGGNLGQGWGETTTAESEVNQEYYVDA